MAEVAINTLEKEPFSDPPRTFEVAEERFSHFLNEQGYPKSICWLTPGSVLVTEGPRYFVRMNRNRALQFAKLRYAEGLAQGLGVALTAVCNSERETFATVIVPTDDIDRQYRLMGKKLKLSCPVSFLRASIVRNPLRWWILAWRNRERSRMLDLQI